MKLYPVSDPRCGCDADVTAETSVRDALRGPPGDRRRKRAKMIFHARRSDGARFWHWSDQAVVRI